MASMGMQLLGFLLSLLGVCATVAATFMVEWRRQAQGKTHRVHEGLWMRCSGNERTTCEFYESNLKLPTELQATRAVMLLSVLLSAVALLVSTMGMKCTRFMDDRSNTKSTTAMIGGIMFMVSGLLILVITSWYVNTIVQTFNALELQSFEFGRAAYVSWAGGLLTMAGGAFLSCRRCSRSRLPASMNSIQLVPTLNPKSPKSNYV